jgi:hypothetical protein
MIEPECPVTLETWRASSFSDESGGRFATLVHADAILVGSVLAQPVAGREAVWNMLRLTGSIYDTLSFVHETRGEDRVYLEWDAAALGLEFGGLTALELDADGWVVRVALHHRPLGAVSRFSAELARRYAASLET